MDLIFKLAQGGGSAALLVVIWLAFQCLKRAQEAIDTLKSIDTKISGLASRVDETHELTAEVSKDIIRLDGALSAMTGRRGHT